MNLNWIKSDILVREKKTDEGICLCFVTRNFVERVVNSGESYSDRQLNLRRILWTCILFTQLEQKIWDLDTFRSS